MLPDWLLPAFGVVLIVEGLLPFLNPGAWRRMFEQALQLRDGQLRFIGAVSLTVGCLLLLVAGR